MQKLPALSVSFDVQSGRELLLPVSHQAQNSADHHLREQKRRGSAHRDRYPAAEADDPTPLQDCLPTDAQHPESGVTNS